MTVWAADAKSPAEPDPSVNPALASLMHAGAKFFYMGRSAGLDGWLAVKDGQIQIIYKPINNAYVMVGYLFAPNGENLTAVQIKQLAATNKELAALATVESSNDFSASGAATPHEKVEDEQVLDFMMSPGERLMKAIDKLSTVTLGTNDKAPILTAIAMPGCEPCQKFWQDFGDAVHKGTLRLRIVPMAPRDTNYERAAAQLLHAPDPLALWEKFAADGSKLTAPDADIATLKQVRANTALGQDWQLSITPFLLYASKTGSIKVVQGNPQQPQTVLDDLVPPPAPASVPPATSTKP
jgi:hypothetical protein